jgi:hypothetical protein
VRLWKGLLVGVVAVGLAGCTSSASTTPPVAGPSPAVTGTTGSPAAPPAPVPTGAKAGVRAAAAQFDSAYFAGRFAAAWSLLAPTVRRKVTERVWVGVHDGCPSATSGVTRAIKAVTVFGNTAIVTETVREQASRHTVEYVFYYMNGHWGYSPADPGIYLHRSVAADIGAAKAAGLCVGWKAF